MKKAKITWFLGVENLPKYKVNLLKKRIGVRRALRRIYVNR